MMSIHHLSIDQRKEQKGVTATECCSSVGLPQDRPPSVLGPAPSIDDSIPRPFLFCSNIHKPTTFPARRMERAEKKLASLAPPRKDMVRMMKRDCDDKWGSLVREGESHPIPFHPIRYFLHHVDGRDLLLTGKDPCY